MRGRNLMPSETARVLAELTERLDVVQRDDAGRAMWCRWKQPGDGDRKVAEDIGDLGHGPISAGHISGVRTKEFGLIYKPARGPARARSRWADDLREAVDRNATRTRDLERRVDRLERKLDLLIENLRGQGVVCAQRPAGDSEEARV